MTFSSFSDSTTLRRPPRLRRVRPSTLVTPRLRRPKRLRGRWPKSREARRRPFVILLLCVETPTKMVWPNDSSTCQWPPRVKPSKARPLSPTTPPSPLVFVYRSTHPCLCHAGQRRRRWRPPTRPPSQCQRWPQRLLPIRCRHPCPLTPPPPITSSPHSHFQVRQCTNIRRCRRRRQCRRPLTPRPPPAAAPSSI
jgi:hypothetical protein